MFQRIILYITLMLIGILVGRSGKIKPKILEKLDLIQFICLLFLLFAMGISMGTNQEVMKSFSTIGLKSVVFAIFTITFSIIPVYFFNKVEKNFFPIKKQKNEKEGRQ